MKLQIWSDVICPWCGIAQHRLARALVGFEHRAAVEVLHRSFQLDPDFASDPRPAREVLSDKGLSEAQISAGFGQLEALAANEGLSPYHISDSLIGNTRLAHELLALASDRGLGGPAWERLYGAYFGQRRSVFDVESLVGLGNEIGLDAGDVREALSDGRFRPRVEADAREALSRGASGVPFMVIDDRRVVSGAQSAERLRQLFEAAWTERARLERT